MQDLSSVRVGLNATLQTTEVLHDPPSCKHKNCDTWVKLIMEKSLKLMNHMKEVPLATCVY